MNYTDLQCSAALATKTGETKSDLIFRTRIHVPAKGLEPANHDELQYTILVYSTVAAADASADPIRLEKLHGDMNVQRGVQFAYTGTILSTDLANYGADVVNNKMTPTTAAQTEMIGIVIDRVTAQLEIQTTDFTIL